MEDLEKKIERFLSYGYGYGSGYGYGYGSGSGSGSGYGYGYGSGDGSGSGSGIGRYRGQKVYYIDGVRTLIDEVKGQFAKGWIIRGDLTVEVCWIARVGNSFAHGKNIYEAHTSALDKELQDMPEEERIDRFVEAHPDMEMSYPGTDLFRWHNLLTGSCEMGRREFCRDRGIDIDAASFTVEEFVKLTCDSYGKEVIRKLAERLSIMV